MLIWWNLEGDSNLWIGAGGLIGETPQRAPLTPVARVNLLNLRVLNNPIGGLDHLGNPLVD